MSNKKKILNYWAYFAIIFSLMIQSCSTQNELPDDSKIDQFENFKKRKETEVPGTLSAQTRASGALPIPTLSRDSQLESESSVVKKRLKIRIRTTKATYELNSTLNEAIDRDSISIDSTSGRLPVHVNLPAITQIRFDTKGFIIPLIYGNLITNFGNIWIPRIFDNDFKHCGVFHNEVCKFAILQTYTSGEVGPGLWNKYDKYSAPLAVILPNGMLKVVRLGPAQVTKLQIISLENKNLLTNSDFDSPLNYIFRADFTKAPDGEYETTLNLEYVLQ